MAGNKNSGHRLDKERMLVASLAREHTEKAIKKLAHIMELGESESAQIQAATALLDRGWGKPAQQLVHSGDEEAPLFTGITVTFVKPNGQP